jgi:hypothetical protein
MTQQQESVVTADRFAIGLTWEQYAAKITRNKDKFEYNFGATVLTDDDANAFRDLVARDNGPARVLALGEDWCPDVVRGLPVMARIAAAAAMELRIFPRDDNLDIMGEFLNHGESQSIPTFVFYTRDHKYIAHWIERPVKANEEMGEMQKMFEGLDRDKDRDKMRQLYDDFQLGPVWGSWRDATVRELRDLLTQKTS